MIRLEPMTDAEFQEFLAQAIPRRAERMVSRDIWSAEHGVEAARAIYARTLPQGNRTPDQHFCHLVLEPGGQRVGEVWYSAYEEGGRTHFYIAWIWVEPPYRRRGYATEALQRLEEEARRRGAARTFLDVWWDNPEALDLYQRLGYRTSRVSLVKPIPPKD